MMILPSGYWICALRLRIAMASASVTGPTRPANIVRINQILPAVDNVGVIPVDNPTVPNAEVTSNKILIKLKCSVIVNAIVTITTNMKAISRMEKAL